MLPREFSHQGRSDIADPLVLDEPIAERANLAGETEAVGGSGARDVSGAPECFQQSINSWARQPRFARELQNGGNLVPVHCRKHREPALERAHATAASR